MIERIDRGGRGIIYPSGERAMAASLLEPAIDASRTGRGRVRQLHAMD